MPTRCRPGETPEQARARQALTMKQWRERRAEHYCLYRRNYTEKNREKLSEYERVRAGKRYRASQEYRDECKRRITRWKEKVGPTYLKAQWAERTKKLKCEIVAAYGGKCTCCGESHFKFLSIDHIDGNGAEHRKEMGGRDFGGYKFYRWLKAHGFPKENFQLLCFNCNMAKGIYGTCEHEDERLQLNPS